MRWFICNSLWQFLVFCRRFENLQLKLTSERHQSSPWAFRSTLQFDPQIKWVDERSMSQVFHDHLETNLVRTQSWWIRIRLSSNPKRIEFVRIRGYAWNIRSNPNPSDTDLFESVSNRIRTRSNSNIRIWCIPTYNYALAQRISILYSSSKNYRKATGA